MGPYLWKSCACISYYLVVISPLLYATISVIKNLQQNSSDLVAGPFHNRATAVLTYWIATFTFENWVFAALENNLRYSRPFRQSVNLTTKLTCSRSLKDQNWSPLPFYFLAISAATWQLWFAFEQVQPGQATVAGSTDFAGLRHSANVTHAMTRDMQGTLPHQLGQLVSMLIILW